MVDEKKIKLMTDIALDESKRYHDEISEGGFFRGDYIRSHVISAVWNVTIAYLLVLVLIVLYRADDLLIHITKISYAPYLGIILGSYLLLLLVTCLFSVYYFSARYRYMIVILQEYYNKLEMLKQFSLAPGEETDP